MPFAAGTGGGLAGADTRWCGRVALESLGKEDLQETHAYRVTACINFLRAGVVGVTLHDACAPKYLCRHVTPRARPRGGVPDAPAPLTSRPSGDAPGELSKRRLSHSNDALQEPRRSFGRTPMASMEPHSIALADHAHSSEAGHISTPLLQHPYGPRCNYACATRVRKSRPCWFRALELLRCLGPAGVTTALTGRRKRRSASWA